MKTGKKTAGFIVCICLSILLLTGCGQTKESNAVESSTIFVSGDGKITTYLVEDFEKDYYNLSELSQMVMDETAEYNRNAKENSVSVISVVMAEGRNDKVIVGIQYNNTDAYKDNNEIELFYGTVAEAKEAGYDLNVELISVSDSAATIGNAEILEMEKRHILIVEEKLNVACPKKVLFYSKEAFVNENGTINLSQTEEGLSYIIMK